MQDNIKESGNKNSVDVACNNKVFVSLFGEERFFLFLFFSLIA